MSEAILKELSLAENTITVKSDILQKSARFVKRISYILRYVGIAAHSDQLTAHPCVSAEQIYVGHILVVKGVESGRIDLKGDVLFDNRIKDGADLVLKKRGICFYLVALQV